MVWLLSAWQKLLRIASSLLVEVYIYTISDARILPLVSTLISLTMRRRYAVRPSKSNPLNDGTHNTSQL